MKTITTALLSVLLLPAVAAQDDACTETDPCIWVVGIDENGFDTADMMIEGTMGDWVVFEFNNLDADGADHVVAFSMDGSTWSVPNLDTVRSAPFPLTEQGVHTLSDDVTGDTVNVGVTIDDVAAPDGDEGAPGVGAGLLLALLAGMALAGRRE